MGRELITVSIGQSGVQMAHSIWELLCLEHGIRADGNLIGNVEYENLSLEDIEAIRTFFAHTQRNVHVPRAVMCDLEPSVIDEIRSGCYRLLHHPNSLFNSAEDAANNFARGYFAGRKLLDPIMRHIRKQVECCDFFQGFLISNGVGGGTGSGMGCLMMEKFSVEYGKSNKVAINIYPGPTMSTAVVEPYNVVLSTFSSMEYSDLNFILDNEAVYSICQNNFVEMRPKYSSLNRLMAQVSSSLTASLRFESSLNADFNQLQTNLIPYPRLHFPAVSYSPIASQAYMDRDSYNPVVVIKDAFEPYSRMVSIDTTKGKYMSIVLQFRGCVSPGHIYSAINAIKRQEKIAFVDWCPTGYKVGISNRPPLSVPRSQLAQCSMNCMMIANTTAIEQIYGRIIKHYNYLYSKRAFIHWYVSEGMEEGEFQDALYVMQQLIEDYKDAGKSSNDGKETECNDPKESVHEVKASISKKLVQPVRKASSENTISSTTLDGTLKNESKFYPAKFSNDDELKKRQSSNASFTDEKQPATAKQYMDKEESENVDNHISDDVDQSKEATNNIVMDASEYVENDDDNENKLNLTEEESEADAVEMDTADIDTEVGTELQHSKQTSAQESIDVTSDTDAEV